MKNPRLPQATPPTLVLGVYACYFFRRMRRFRMSLLIRMIPRNHKNVRLRMFEVDNFIAKAVPIWLYIRFWNWDYLASSLR